MELADDFWLQLHVLDRCLDGDGPERLNKTVAAWQRMPAAARQISILELSHLLAELGKLRPLVGQAAPAAAS
jgi:hypothetical protein